MKTTQSYFFQLVIWLSICASAFVLTSCVPAQKTQKQKKALVQKCIDCHQEFKTKFTTGNIHAPVKDESCYSCHRPHGLYGKIVFRRDQPVLCYTCHTDVKPEDSAESVHGPVQTDKCTVCHEPHNSDYYNLLKNEGDESCFACHEKESFRRQISHKPLEQGCNTCHDPHSTKNVSLLKQKPDATCLSCHNVSEQNFVNAHFSYPVSTGCIQCHTPHSASAKGLLKKIVHEPIRNGECDSCHQVNASKEITAKGKADTLCLECHEIHNNEDSVHEPYTQGQCTACHDVHASDYNNLFAEAPEKVCVNCHAESMGLQSEVHSEDKNADKKKTPGYKPASRHKPVVEGKCLECHSGHTSKYTGLLNQPLKTLCYKCHKQDEYAEVSGSHPPAKKTNCDTCHVPHDSQAKSLLKGGSERDLCFGCHKETAIERGKFSLHKPFSRGECGKCHQLHRPKEAVYLSSSYRDGKLCETCHESTTRVSESYSLHDPVSKGQCFTCHSPHATDFEHVMVLPQGEQCYTCHKDVKSKFANNKVQHQPAMKGNCTSCHSAHGSAQKAILKKNQPALCVSCHLEIAKDWLEGYAHKPAVKSCLQCHGSHGADRPGILIKSSGTLCLECHDVQTDQFNTAHGQIKPRPDTCVSCHDPHGSKVKSMLYPVVHNPFQEGTCAPCHKGGSK